MTVSGQTKNIFYLLCAAVAAAMLLALFAGLARNLTPAFRARLQKKAASAPVFKKARELGLTYEAALSSPVNAINKPVLWCVHLSSAQAYHGQGTENPLDIPNKEEMPWQLYPNRRGHLYCRNALMEITGVKIYDFAGVRVLRLQTRFIDYR